MGPGTASSDKKVFAALWGAFGVQVSGRLLDLQWHRTHSEFETGADQVTAHWLVWLGTVLILAVAVWGLRTGPPPPERRGYLLVLWSNVVYVAVAVAHFIQHLDRQEVDWAHIGLAITNIGSLVGVVFMVTPGWVRRGAPRGGAAR